MTRVLISILILTFTCSCSKEPKKTETVSLSSNYKMNYAQGFKVEKTDDYTHIIIRNPWDTTTLLQSYVLVKKDRELPNDLPKGVIIRTPISKATASSAIQCSTLDELNSLEIIAGVCEPHYIKQNYITQGVAEGKIVDLGKANSPSSEAIMLLSPEVIFSDPVTGQSQASIEKAKIPIIQTPDYTEPHPLGRAEWIRFYSLFVDQESLADSLFAITERNYNEVKNLVASANSRPTVFTDTRYQGNWNMAGGKSYMAKLLEDAGANYLWADTESTTFLPLTFEAVLDKASEADKWLIRYYDKKHMTYESLEKEYKPYSYFKPFKEKQIYGSNTMYSTYFDDLPIHPDYILKDLAHVFHPNLFPDYKAKYYKQFE